MSKKSRKCQQILDKPWQSKFPSEKSYLLPFTVLNRYCRLKCYFDAALYGTSREFYAAMTLRS